MYIVPREIAEEYRAMVKSIRRSHYLLGELVLHPDCDLSNPETLKQIERMRDIQVEVAKKRDTIERVIWKQFGKGAELVRQQRALIKGEK